MSERATPCSTADTTLGRADYRRDDYQGPWTCARAGATHREPGAFTDLVQQQFRAAAPGRLGHRHHPAPHERGLDYPAVVLDVHTRRCVGWSIGDHLRADLIDALDMAGWRRKPADTIVHSDRGANIRAGCSASGCAKPD
ncbi:MAG: DDE-type integrase/transposase/recombinase [Actinomycetota bacterium]|nr:DDE-type integrase/transposase/recombinase [Actinomycetota bacterium]